MTKAKRAEKPETTRKKSIVIEAILDGKTQREAIALADAHPRVPNAPDVRAAVEAARAELSSATQYTRASLVAGLQEAVDLAKLMADPASMIRGYTEIGKMLGLYAPEQKKIDLTINQERLQSKFRALTDQELLEIAEGTATLVEGEYVRVS